MISSDNWSEHQTRIRVSTTRFDIYKSEKNNAIDEAFGIDLPKICFQTKKYHVKVHTSIIATRGKKMGGGQQV